MRSADRKICNEGHCMASQGMPNDGFFNSHLTPVTDTFSCMCTDEQRHFIQGRTYKIAN